MSTPVLTRKKSKRFANQSFHKLTKLSNDVGLVFNDAIFKQTNDSIFETSHYKSCLDIGKVFWKRPQELCDDEETCKLLPSKSNQAFFCANGPNKWFIAACLAISQYRPLVNQLVCKDNDAFTKHGIIKFSIWQFGTKQKVVIDDKLPVCDSKLVFSHFFKTNCSTEIANPWWIPLLEKAYAKLHGSYESMAVNGSIFSALIDFTDGGVVESVQFDSPDSVDWDLICKEYSLKSLILLKTKDNFSNGNLFDLSSNRYYLICGVKKSTSTLKKLTRSSSNISDDSVLIVNTVLENPKSNFSPKLPQLWIQSSSIYRQFQSMVICRPYAENKDRIQHCSLNNNNSKQICFDVTSSNSTSVVINIIQNVRHIIPLGFRIYSVELNRKFKVHDFSKLTLMNSLDPVKQRNVIQKLVLPYGRYLLNPICNTSTSLFISILSSHKSDLIQLCDDMPRYQLVPMIPPKYPCCVSRITVHGVDQLDKQDRFGSANTYCIIRCGRKVVKSSCANETLTPQWVNFSALFYHRKIEPIQVEIWHRSLLMDYFVGLLLLMPKVNCFDEVCDSSTAQENNIQYKQLTDKKDVQKRTGVVKYELYTSENLKHF